VGIGSWPEIYPHYQRPPWRNTFFFRQPENDYLQLAAETGLAGLAIVAWMAWMIFVPLSNGARQLKSRDWPLFAGVAAGLSVALIHEFFDFSFQTPSNMILFTVLLAMLLRIALTKGVARPVHALRSVSSPDNQTFVKAALVGLVATGLIGLVIIQPEVEYPFDVKDPKTFAAAEAAVVTHPARASTHIALAALMPPAAPKRLVVEELQDAVWLDPNDPFGRDLYARSLFLTGDKAEALRQIASSIRYAPSLDAHFYLAHAMIPWLLPEEQQAVAQGFTEAVKANYDPAPQQLAEYYATLGREAAAARVDAAAAADSTDPQARADYMIDAARHYAAAKDLKNTRAILLRAADADPTDPRPLAELIVLVLGPERDIAQAHKLVQAGIERGGDPEQLELALADAALKAGDGATVDEALQQVLNREPSFDETMAAGSIYSIEGSYDRAAVVFERAVEMDQQSAAAVFALARAEEEAYQYALAERDYAHALALDPNNDDMRRRYLQFQRRVAEANAQGNSSGRVNAPTHADSSELQPVRPDLAPGG
jgi:tetratricopeptide (TPR) repeat protein